MIEVTAKEVDGVRFIDKIKIVSWEKRNGLPVQLVDDRTWREPEVKRMLKMLMLEEVDFDFCCRIHIYAQRPVNDICYKVILLGIHLYWKTIRFIYDNGRVFKQIPEEQMFSWRYFTPYVWYRRIKDGVVK